MILPWIIRSSYSELRSFTSRRGYGEASASLCVCGIIVKYEKEDMLQVITILVFATFLCGSILGLYVFSRDPSSKLLQAFGLTVLGMAGWNLSIFLLVAGAGPALLPGKLAFSFGAMLVTGFAYFAFIYFKLSEKRHWLFWFFGVLGIVFFVIPLTPLFVTEIEVIDGSVTGDLNPILTNLWGLHYLFTLFFSFFYLLVKAFKAKGVERHRAQQLLLGFGLFLFPMFITQFVLPMGFQDFRWNNLGPVFSFFLIVFLTNAVLRYRLLDIRWIVGKSLFVTAAISIVLWVVISVSFLLSELVGSTAATFTGALIVVLIFKPVWNFLEKIFDSLIDFGGYDSDSATEEVFAIVRSYGELKDLMPKLSERFSEYFSLQEIAFFIKDGEKNKVIGQHVEGFSTALATKATKLFSIAKAAKYEILERTEMEWIQEFGQKKNEKKKQAKWLEVFKKHDIDTLIPLTVEKKLVGVMVFGKRRYEQAMHGRDITFLNLVRAGISPAFENAVKFAQIEGLYVQLKEVDKVKSEFISVVSHRFRTPLSAIRWNVETALESPSCAKSMECTQSLEDAHNRTLFLTDTLDRLFDSLAIESGKFKLAKEIISTKKVFSEIGKFLTKQCKERGLTCTADIAGFTLEGDEKRLQSVCKTLVSNAMQYTDAPGSINFVVKKQGDKAVIQVEDTGIGIPEKSRDKVYDKFFRAQNAIHAYTDGQGLGLYFAKKIIELHKGDIDFVSQEGEGTTFTIKLPLNSKKRKRKTKKK